MKQLIAYCGLDCINCTDCKTCQTLKMIVDNSEEAKANLGL